MSRDKKNFKKLVGYIKKKSTLVKYLSDSTSTEMVQNSIPILTSAFYELLNYVLRLCFHLL